MDVDYSAKVLQLRRKLLDFMDNYVVPNIPLWKT